MAYLIPAVIIALSLAVIGRLAWAKLAQLRAIDVADLPEEQQRAAKKQLLLGRLRRGLHLVRDRAKPAAAGLRSWGRDLYRRVQDKEREYRRRAAQAKQEQAEAQGEEAPARGDDVDEMLASADGHRQAGEYEAAEAGYVDVLNLDGSNLAAYGGLSEVYLQTKEYDKALETTKFTLKLLRTKKAGSKASREHQQAVARADLGEIYRAVGKLDLAKAEFERAVKLQPNNPRYLDLLLKISILLKNKTLAKRTLAQLKKVDSGNQKLDDLARQVRSLE